MSIFIIYQCVEGASATSDSVSYLGISSSQISANCCTKSKKSRGKKKERAKLLKNWHKEMLCKKRWSKNKTRN